MRILNVIQPCLVALAFLLATAVSSRADIYRWDNGQLIPGTEGITPGPGVQLDHRELEFASLTWNDLTNARFDYSNLTGARLNWAILTSADLSGAVVTGAEFGRNTDSTGITKEQLYSTASYQAKNLTGVGLSFNYLSGWDFHGQVVTGASFSSTTSLGFTKEQLYSTVSYQAKNLAGIRLGSNDLRGWDFTGQNLANASFSTAVLTNASLSGSVVAGADFTRSSAANGITKEQLYSTASYQEKNLAGVRLSGYDLNGWDFSGQVVTGAHFASTTLTKEQLYSTASYEARDLAGINLGGSTDVSGWDFSGQDLTNAGLSTPTLKFATLTGAVVTGANFRNSGISQEQLYSTASYQQKNLARISLERNDLTGWDFHGQNLANASFYASKLTNANLSGANLANGIFTPAYLTNADLSAADARGAVDSSGQPLDLTGANSFNTIRPDGIIAGLNLAAGDQLDIRNYLGDSRQGLGPIPIVVHDALNMEDGSALKMLFDAEHWNSTISFQSGILVSLGGSLELAFADGVLAAEQAGRTFDLFDWTGVSPTGAFTVDSDYLWDLSQLYSSGEVTLLSALAGDTDHDGVVNIEDLNNVRNNFGGAGLGDTNQDGVINIVDLNAVRNNYGAAAGAQSVPEPSSTILLAGGGMVLGIAARTRRALTMSRNTAK